MHTGCMKACLFVACFCLQTLSCPSVINTLEVLPVYSVMYLLIGLTHIAAILMNSFVWECFTCWRRENLHISFKIVTLKISVIISLLFLRIGIS